MMTTHSVSLLQRQTNASTQRQVFRAEIGLTVSRLRHARPLIQEQQQQQQQQLQLHCTT